MTSAQPCPIPFGIDYRLVDSNNYNPASNVHENDYHHITSQALDFLQVLSRLNLNCPKKYDLDARKSRIGILISCFWPEKYLNCFLDNLLLLNERKRLVPIFINAGMSESSKKSINDILESGHFVDYGFIDKIGCTIYDAWNTGIEYFREKVDYFTNFNVDDLRHPLCLDVQAAILDTFPEKQVAITDYLYFFQTHKDLLYVYKDHKKTCTFLPVVNYRTLTFGNYPHSGPMWRSSVHTNLNLYFDGASFSAGDADFWFRLSQLIYDAFYVVSIPLNLYYYNPQGLSTSLVSKGPKEYKNYKERHCTHLKAFIKESSSNYYPKMDRNIPDYNFYSLQLAHEALRKNV